MSDLPPSDKPPEDDAPRFDGDSPRWRDGGDSPGDVERDRRFRGQASPRQRGAIDAERSVSGSAPSPEPPPEEGSGEPTDVGD